MTTFNTPFNGCNTTPFTQFSTPFGGQFGGQFGNQFGGFGQGQTFPWQNIPFQNSFIQNTPWQSTPFFGGFNGAPFGQGFNQNIPFGFNNSPFGNTPFNSTQFSNSFGGSFDGFTPWNNTFQNSTPNFPWSGFNQIGFNTPSFGGSFINQNWNTPWSGSWPIGGSTNWNSIFNTPWNSYNTPWNSFQGGIFNNPFGAIPFGGFGQFPAAPWSGTGAFPFGYSTPTFGGPFQSTPFFNWGWNGAIPFGFINGWNNAGWNNTTTTQTKNGTTESNSSVSAPVQTQGVPFGFPVIGPYTPCVPVNGDTAGTSRSAA